MSKAFLGLGSNLGDRKKNLAQAMAHIERLSQTKCTKNSNWLETKALTRDPEETQPDYLNGVIEIETELPPTRLLQQLKNIEKEMGREISEQRWQPRIIDIDILFYDDLLISMATLIIPHPEMHKRLFVLQPMREIAPNFVHPLYKKTILELLETCSSSSSS